MLPELRRYVPAVLGVLMLAGCTNSEAAAPTRIYLPSVPEHTTIQPHTIPNVPERFHLKSWSMDVDFGCTGSGDLNTHIAVNRPAPIDKNKGLLVAIKGTLTGALMRMAYLANTGSQPSIIDLRIPPARPMVGSTGFTLQSGQTYIAQVYEASSSTDSLGLTTDSIAFDRICSVAQVK